MWGGRRTGIIEKSSFILGSIVVLVIAILPINETGKFIHLFVSSIVLISGLKFKWTSSDSLGEIFIPRYLMVSVMSKYNGLFKTSSMN